MKKRKKVLIIALVCLLLPSVAACNGGGDTSSTATFSSTTDISAVSTTTSSMAGIETGTQTTDKDTRSTTAGSKTDSDIEKQTTTSSQITTTKAPTTKAPSVAVGKQNLSNTAVKLTKTKKLTVGFIGGSVTVGTGASSTANGWRMKTVEWLKSAYAADVQQVNASIGGTGSYYGLMRADENLLSGKPDLVFIEFAINDSYLNYSQSDSARYMESLVRKCYESNPNMDIVLVYTTDQNKKGAMTQWIRAFNTVASHYGLITVDAGAYMKEQIGTGNWADYYSDTSHPNDTGHDLLFQAVSQAVRSGVEAYAGATALKQHDIPSATRDDLLLDTKMIHAADIEDENADITVNAASYEAPNGSVRLSAGQSITISFEGTSVGVYWDRASRYSDNVKCVIDGKDTIVKNLCTTSGGSYQYILFDGLASGKHTLVIRNEGNLPVKINELFISK